MPIPTNVSNSYEESRIIKDELDYNVSEQNDIVSQNLTLLNADQLSIYNIIIAAVNDTNSYSNAFFIDGPGGTGKTCLYNTLLSTVRSQGNISLAMASSGIAALLLQGGRTVHSRMKVLIHLNEISVCSISKQSALARLIQRTRLFVWDEAPMTHRHAAECIDRTLRDLCSCYIHSVAKLLCLEVISVKFYL